MEAGFDQYAENHEKRIAEQSRTAYSDTVVDRIYNPRNLGRLADPDAYGIVHGWCGDTMEIFLRLMGETISAARFLTDGCGPTAACGSMLTSLIEGLSREKAEKITPQQLIEALDGLPKGNEHCAQLAVDTLLSALRNRSDEHPRAEGSVVL